MSAIPAGPTIARPQRWDSPFDSEMTDEMVEGLLDVKEIAGIQADKFPARIPLEGILKNDTRIINYKPGDIIVRQGDYGNSAFLVLDGDLRVVVSPGLPADIMGRNDETQRTFFNALSQLWTNRWFPEVRDDFSKSKTALRHSEDKTDAVRGVFLQDVPAVLDQHKTVVLSEGALFGELAALGRVPRTASIFAEGEATLLEIRWQGLRELRNYDEGWRRIINKRYRETALRTHLNETPMFKGLSDEVMKKIADQCLFETYGSFEWHTSFKQARNRGIDKEPIIAREREYPDGLLLIRAGFARESIKHGNSRRTVTYLGAGDHYGLEELYSAWKNPNDSDAALHSSLTSLGYVDAIRVPAPVLEEFVFPNMNPPESRIEKVQSRSIDQDSLLEWAVEERFINARQAMVIDMDKCVRCDDCVRACASTHGGNPRFRRHGKTHDHWMVANACMHCVDPVCMIGCPTGAIHRSLSGGRVIINDKTCIGCGTCANSCPYNNISMVNIADSGGTRIVDEATHKPIMKATKCDLCTGQLGGPACVRACPNGALKRVSFNEFDA